MIDEYEVIIQKTEQSSAAQEQEKPEGDVTDQEVTMLERWKNWSDTVDR